MRSRLRTTDDELRPYMSMRCTGNPGGVGGWWIKKMYIDPSDFNKPFAATDVESGQQLLYPEGHEKARQPLFYRKFIPARLTDNPYLMQDGRYEAMLRSLPEVERKRLLEGDWDVAEGAAFPEFSKEKHVVEPFEVPTNWPRIRAADYGYASPSCVLWGAIDWDNNIWIYRELYVTKNTADQFARKVLELEHGEYINYGVLDSSTWAKRGDVGPSIAETMIQNGCRWRPSDRSPKSRISGKLEIHKRLKVNDEEPGIRIFKTCRNLIRTLGSLPTDDKNPEDVDTNAEDHAYDALRYGCMSRPTHPKYAERFRTSFTDDTYRMADNKFGY